MIPTPPDWKLFLGDGNPRTVTFPQPPPWRDLEKGPEHQGRTYCATSEDIETVNAAIYLRRPLLLEGPPGFGKSSLAFAVAEELQLGAIHHWPINSRSTLREGLYLYDALGRMHHSERPIDGTESDDIGSFISLGPLGTALLPAERPAVLLIDEIDKSDIDLPNDLLHVLENGWFRIPELVRYAAKQPDVHVLIDPGVTKPDTNLSNSKLTPTTSIHRGIVKATTFPFVVITSNGERELPQAFLRRCIRHTIVMPDEVRLRQIVEAHLGSVSKQGETSELLSEFLRRLTSGEMLAIDQLLNAVFLLNRRPRPSDSEWQNLSKILLRPLNES